MRLFKTLPFVLLVCVAPFAARAADSVELHVEHASIVGDSADQKAIRLELTPDSRKAFGEFTTRHLNETIDLKVDGEVLMSPRLMEPILGGEVMVSGMFQPGELEKVAKRVSEPDAKVEAAVHEE